MLSQLSLPTGAKAQYSYDAMQRLTQVSNKTSANANISSYAYGFDAANQPQRDVRTWVDKTIGNNATRRTSFSYDTVDQLVSEVLNEAVPLTNKQYAYDAMGNRSTSTSKTATSTFATSHQSNRLNQYRSVSTSWDGGANSSASTLSYDASGNLTKMASVGTGAGGSGQAEYSYDDADRLTGVVRNDGAGVNQSKSEYVYDGSSRLRISREYSWNGTAWTQSSEKRRIYDGMDVIQERDGNNAVTATYTRDGNIGGILSKRNAAGEDYFYHYDSSGNVAQLTDANQNTVAEYSYDAFGNTLSLTVAHFDLYQRDEKGKFISLTNRMQGGGQEIQAMLPTDEGFWIYTRNSLFFRTNESMKQAEETVKIGFSFHELPGRSKIYA